MLIQPPLASCKHCAINTLSQFSPLPRGRETRRGGGRDGAEIGQGGREVGVREGGREGGRVVGGGSECALHYVFT